MIERGCFSERERDALADLLDGGDPPWRAGIVPPLGHWLAFPPHARQSALGPDGHPRRTDHAELPRRMWAGSRIRFLADMTVGAPLQRTTETVSQAEKHGRSGRMVFVTLRHEIHCDEAIAVVEEQDIVYRAMPAAANRHQTVAALPYRADGMTLVPDSALLFRFSALTYNAHRIHYDLPYAQAVEGYRGLVVHGPLIATVLMDRLLRQRAAQIPKSFAFRAVAPLVAGEPMRLSVEPDGEQATLSASGPDGLAMTAEASFST